MAETGASSKLRAVLDTHVVLSALLFRANPLGTLRRPWQARAFVPLADKPAVQELMRVLAYPTFKLSLADQQALLADYLPWAEVIQLGDPPDTLRALPKCRDPHDQAFLELAHTGHADWLVTGDLELIALAGSPHLGFRIGTPTAFLEHLSAPSA